MAACVPERANADAGRRGASWRVRRVSVGCFAPASCRGWRLVQLDGRGSDCLRERLPFERGSPCQNQPHPIAERTPHRATASCAPLASCPPTQSHLLPSHALPVDLQAARGANRSHNNAQSTLEQGGRRGQAARMPAPLRRCAPQQGARLLCDHQHHQHQQTAAAVHSWRPPRPAQQLHRPGRDRCGSAQPAREPRPAAAIRPAPILAARPAAVPLTLAARGPRPAQRRLQPGWWWRATSSPCTSPAAPPRAR
jgi:hypothetical protein